MKVKRKRSPKFPHHLHVLITKKQIIDLRKMAKKNNLQVADIARAAFDEKLSS